MGLADDSRRALPRGYYPFQAIHGTKMVTGEKAVPLPALLGLKRLVRRRRETSLPLALELSRRFVEPLGTPRTAPTGGNRCQRRLGNKEEGNIRERAAWVA